MNYEGKVYRPWIEANSLLIQVTLGCSHNTCTFCDMFSDKRFRVRKVEDIFADIEQARKYYPYVPSIFLIDGNVMVLKTATLLKVLNKIKETFPECKKISLYSSFNDLKRKSVEDLKLLKEAGLDMAYIGLESGDRETLERIEKGMTPEEAVEGMANAKAAGIRVLASFIFGMGGKERSKEHIEETVKLLNILQPEEIAPMALAIQPNTKLEQQVESGEFVRATPLQILHEEKYLLENMNFETVYWGDHGNNIAPMRGYFPDLKASFLNRINHEIETNPITKQKVHNTYAW
ncbi:B12-binding domain-containing radical SAM protein [Sediminitomix flava]|uniref:Radical SAM family protein n=1 Tax=Sediminitomix flava TaxID=379075 RepID=A0A315ZE77_SEDFL|nr:radical SAM protein [Sediminitomix flava]PWJ43044.1 radical SAM family protein [Sediminitomix flava]